MQPNQGIVVVTGASGFVGSHVTRELLARGHHVRGTVRDPADPSRTAHLRALAEGLPGRLELVRGDLLEPGSFDEAVSGAKAMIHTAAVALLAAPNAERTIVRPSLEGTRNVLAAIEKAGTVEVLVHTSSVAAMVSHYVEGRVYTEDDWSDDATLASDPYGLAKREAERLVHAFAEQHELRVATINPTLVWGPVFAPAHARGSPSVLRDLIVGSYPACPNLAFGIVDAREVAVAHAEALERDEARGRFILYNEFLWMRELALELQRQQPGWKVNTGRLPNFVMWLVALFDKRVSSATLRQMLGRRIDFDTTRSRAILGITYRPVSETMADTVASLVEQGLATPKLRR